MFRRSREGWLNVPPRVLAVCSLLAAAVYMWVSSWSVDLITDYKKSFLSVAAMLFAITWLLQLGAARRLRAWMLLWLLVPALMIADTIRRWSGGDIVSMAALALAAFALIGTPILLIARSFSGCLHVLGMGFAVPIVLYGAAIMATSVANLGHLERRCRFGRPFDFTGDIQNSMTNATALGLGPCVIGVGVVLAVVAHRMFGGQRPRKLPNDAVAADS